MKIKTIEINNYKAFYKTHIIEAGGKNLFIYGENGSGKSSLYYALKDFFQSSREKIDFDELENIFLTKTEKGDGYVKVTFNPNKDGHTADANYEFGSKRTTTFQAGDTSIRDAIGLKSFLTYKHLLGVHNIKKGKEIDLFDLLVNGVLKHFRSAAITGTKELGELWADIDQACAKELDGRRYTAADKKTDVEACIKVFNDSFRELFKDTSPEYILKHAQPVLDEFHYNISIKLVYTETRPNTDYSGVTNNQVKLSLEYLGKVVTEPHLFLNEAKLSAIAISIYLGMVLRHPQLSITVKILFLDDIFIGLDIANRLPLIEILKKYFIATPGGIDYQVFITTYDKPWYEFMKFYLAGDTKWKTVELYNRRARMGFEIPIIKPSSGSDFIKDLIDTAENHYNNADNKAAGVYLRSAFEFMLKSYCCNGRRNLPVAFELDQSKLTSDSFWKAIITYKTSHPAKCALTTATQSSIEHYRKLVLNPLSHHDVNKHEFGKEIAAAIMTLRTLKTELAL